MRLRQSRPRALNPEDPSTRFAGSFTVALVTPDYGRRVFSGGVETQCRPMTLCPWGYVIAYREVGRRGTLNGPSVAGTPHHRFVHAVSIPASKRMIPFEIHALKGVGGIFENACFFDKMLLGELTYCCGGTNKNQQATYRVTMPENIDPIITTNHSGGTPQSTTGRTTPTYTAAQTIFSAGDI